MSDAGSSAALNRRRLLIFGAGAAAVSVTGLAASRFVRSPQQFVSDKKPPGLTVLTAQVQRRILRDTVVLRGQVGAGYAFDVTPAPRDVERVILTGIRVRAGQEFKQGDVLLEVSGRPLFALLGTVPAYRDLHPGLTGRDVAQLQSALKRLGFDPRETPGIFGSGTKQALASFYTSLGYQPGIDGDPTALAAAHDRTRNAQRTLTEAQKSLARLVANPPSNPDPSQPDPIEQAQNAAQYAKEDLTAAQDAQAEMERTSGPMLPLSEMLFLPSFPARVEKISGSVGGEVKAPLITVSSGDLVVRAHLNPGQRALLRPTLSVEIVAELLSLQAHGVVSSIGDLEQGEDGTRSYPMTVTPAAGTFDKRLAGQDVRLTVEAAATRTEVLVVPISALFAGADGRVGVLRVAQDGTQERIIVTPGVSGDGYVAITPVAGTVNPGDPVVVGEGHITGATS